MYFDELGANTLIYTMLEIIDMYDEFCESWWYLSYFLEAQKRYKYIEWLERWNDAKELY